MRVQYQRNIDLKFASCVFEMCENVKHIMLVKNSAFPM